MLLVIFAFCLPQMFTYFQLKCICMSLIIVLLAFGYHLQIYEVFFMNLGIVLFNLKSFKVIKNFKQCRKNKMAVLYFLWYFCR